MLDNVSCSAPKVDYSGIALLDVLFTTQFEAEQVSVTKAGRTVHGTS